MVSGCSSGSDTAAVSRSTRSFESSASPNGKWIGLERPAWRLAAIRPRRETSPLSCLRAAGSAGLLSADQARPLSRPAPHIHFKAKKGGKELLTSQINIAGHPGNELDGIVRGGISVFDRELL